MRINNDPHGFCAGQKWLALLQKKSCPNFRTYTDYIRTALSSGKYSQEELGATEEEVLMLAVNHASEAARGGYPAQIALRSELRCQLEKVRGANRLPAYAQEVNKKIADLQTERTKRAA